MQLRRLPRWLALSTPLALLVGLSLTACTIDGLDELGSSGSDDDEDEEVEDTEAAETEGDDDERPSIESGDDEEGGDTEGAQESGEDPSESGGEDPQTSGGEPTPDACEAYCEVELACDAYFASVQECMDACSSDAATMGECTDPFLGMMACLGTLDCEAFASFWASVDELYQTGEVAPFACDQAFIDFANCAQEA